MEDNSINKCFRVGWVLYLVYLIERPLLNNRSVDVITMILLTLVLFWGVIRNICLFTFKDALIFIVIVMCILMSLLHTCGNITLSLLKSTFCFFATYMLIVVVSRSVVNRRTFDFVYICTIVASLLFIVYYFTPIAYLAETGSGKKYISDGFTCNLGNPNYTGIVLFILFMNLFINVRIRKNKVFITTLMFCLFFLILKTGSRACFLSIGVALVFSIYDRIKYAKGGGKISKSFIILVTLIPVFFIWLYLAMYYSGVKNVEILNKSLFSGREITYIEYLRNIRDIPEFLIGNIVDTQFNNAHNGPLAIFCSIGLIGLISIYVINVSCINNINNGTWISSICVVCILCVFIHACVEAAFMVGGMSSIVGMSTFYFLSSFNEGKNELENNAEIIQIENVKI